MAIATVMGTEIEFGAEKYVVLRESELTAEEMACLAEQVREVKLSIGNGVAERLAVLVLLVMAIGYVGSRLFD